MKHFRRALILLGITFSLFLPLYLKNQTVFLSFAAVIKNTIIFYPETKIIDVLITNVQSTNSVLIAHYVILILLIIVSTNMNLTSYFMVSMFLIKTFWVICLVILGRLLVNEFGLRNLQKQIIKQLKEKFKT